MHVSRQKSYHESLLNFRLALLVRSLEREVGSEVIAWCTFKIIAEHLSPVWSGQGGMIRNSLDSIDQDLPRLASLLFVVGLDSQQ